MDAGTSRMSPPTILLRIMAALDKHFGEHGVPPSVLRLGRLDVEELDVYVRKFSLEGSFGEPTGPNANFEGVPIEVMNEDRFLSTDRDSE